MAATFVVVEDAEIEVEDSGVAIEEEEEEDDDNDDDDDDDLEGVLGGASLLESSSETAFSFHESPFCCRG